MSPLIQILGTVAAFLMGAAGPLIYLIKMRGKAIAAAAERDKAITERLSLPPPPPVTQEQLYDSAKRAALAAIREAAEDTAVRSRREEVARLREQLDDDIRDLRQELAHIRKEIADLRVEMAKAKS